NPSKLPLVSIASPFGSAVRCAPIQSKFSNATPSGSKAPWHAAHIGFLRCSSSICRLVCGMSGLGCSVVSTLSGGGGMSRQRICSLTNTPRAVGDVSPTSSFDVGARIEPRLEQGRQLLRHRLPERGGVAGIGARFILECVEREELASVVADA